MKLKNWNQIAVQRSGTKRNATIGETKSPLRRGALYLVHLFQVTRRVSAGPPVRVCVFQQRKSPGSRWRPQTLLLDDDEEKKKGKWENEDLRRQLCQRSDLLSFSLFFFFIFQHFHLLLFGKLDFRILPLLQNFFFLIFNFFFFK